MAVKFLNEKTYIDAIGIITKQDLSQMKEQIRETAIGFATIAYKTVKFELKIGKDGSFKSFDLNVTVNDEIVNEIVTILKNLGATIDKTENDGLNVSAKLSVYIGELKNELKFDYDKLINDLDVKIFGRSRKQSCVNRKKQQLKTKPPVNRWFCFSRIVLKRYPKRGDYAAVRNQLDAIYGAFCMSVQNEG